MKNSIFISHASEDKEEIVRPIATELLKRGFNVWYDEFTLTVGDNLRKAIDEGLSDCEFGIVVLSNSFFLKDWPQLELEGLVSKEINNGKTILPIWPKVSKNEVQKFSPILSNKLGISSEKGVDFIADQIIQAIEKKKEGLKLRKTVFLKKHFDIQDIVIEGTKFIEELSKSWLNEYQINNRATAPKYYK